MRASANQCAQPLLTVIVPVYNEAETIKELLRKVLDATLCLAAATDVDVHCTPRTEVIVVDDGSTDGTTQRLAP